jgi:hypothetical protein
VTIYLYSIDRLITKFVMYNCEIINFARYKYFVTYKFCNIKFEIINFFTEPFYEKIKGETENGSLGDFP